MHSMNPKARLFILIIIVLMMIQSTVYAETYGSIEEVIGSTPERWIESYNTSWRTITIDAEVDMPSVKELPIVRIQKMPAVQKEKLSIYKGTVRNVDGILRADKKIDDYIKGNSKPKNTYSYSRGQVPEQKPENVEMTYEEALMFSFEEIERLWGLKEDSFCIDEVHIQDCFYYYSGKNQNIVWGKPETDKGRYLIIFNQKIHGIDIEAGNECYDYTDMKAENLFYGPYCYISLSDEQNIKIRAALYQEINMVYTDVPIVSFDNAKKAIETEIYAGHLRSIDVVKLCYIPYLDSKDKNILWLVPAWYVKGLYTRDARENLEMWTSDDGATHESLEKHEVIVEAQSGELLDYTDTRKNRRIVPKILTWKDIY